MRVLLACVALVACGGGGSSGNPDAESDAITQMDGGGDVVTSDGGSMLSLDPSFGANGVVTTAMRASTDYATMIFRQSSGAYLVAGLDASNSSEYVARFTAAGALDTTFGTSGFALVPGPFAPGFLQYTGGFALQKDDKLLVPENLLYAGDVARLDANGALDATFGTGGKCTLTKMFPWAVAVQGDGKIIVVGGDPKDSNYAFMMTRLTGAGVVDSTFGNAGYVSVKSGTESAIGAGVAIDPNGNIVVPGGSLSGLLVRRFTPAGTLDTTFGGTGVVTSPLVPPFTQFSLRAFAVQADGKILLGGKNNNGAAVERFGTNGAVDLTFGTNGFAQLPAGSTTDATESVSVAPDGSILATALSTVCRLSPGGAIDATFGGGHPSVSFTTRGALELSNGTVVAVGDTLQSKAWIAALTNAGAPDSAFGSSGASGFTLGASNDEVLGVALAGDGSIVAAGRASPFGTSGAGWTLARYKPNGALDTSFATQGIYTSPNTPSYTSRGVRIDSAGRIVTAGSDVFGFIAARFTAAGALDAAYGTNGIASYLLGMGGACHAMTLDAGERLVLAGFVIAPAPNQIQATVARLTTSGALDTTFGGTGFLAAVWNGSTNGGSAALAAQMQADGKIVAAGTASVNGGYGVSVARYTDVGTLDASFGTGGIVTTKLDPNAMSPWQAARALAIQPDKKIVVAGSAGFPLGSIPTPDDFDNYVAFGQSRLLVARFNPDGMLDASFGQSGVFLTDFGFKVAIGQGVQVLANGSLVVVGAALDGTTKRGLITQLDANGTLDTSFGQNGFALTSAGAGTGLRAVALQGDGKLVLGGHAFMNPTGWDFALFRLQ